MADGIRVTVEDLGDGTVETVEIPPGEYLLICAEPCYRDYVTQYVNGTHVITVKGRTA